VDAATPPPTLKQVTLLVSFSRGVPYDKTESRWKNIMQSRFHIAVDWDFLFKKELFVLSSQWGNYLQNVQ